MPIIRIILFWGTLRLRVQDLGLRALRLMVSQFLVSGFRVEAWVLKVWVWA